MYGNVFEIQNASARFKGIFPFTHKHFKDVILFSFTSMYAYVYDNKNI